MQSTEDIKKQIEEVKNDDFFGANREELLSALPFEDVKDFLTEEATEEDWDALRVKTDEDVRKAAKKYLPFAIGKALEHRGLSSIRSIDHFKGWVFLVGGPEALEELTNTDYAQYGVPQLKKACELLGIEGEWKMHAEAGTSLSEKLIRMAQGELCENGCASGCGE